MCPHLVSLEIEVNQQKTQQKNISIFNLLGIASLFSYLAMTIYESTFFLKNMFSHICHQMYNGSSFNHWFPTHIPRLKHVN